MVLQALVLTSLLVLPGGDHAVDALRILRTPLLPYQKATLDVGGAWWSFQPDDASGTGIAVRVVQPGSDGTREFHLKFDGVGQVVAIVAAVRGPMIGLGLASLGQSGQTLDYGLAFCQR